MKKITRFLTLLLGLGLVAGGAVTFANHKDSKEAKADVVLEPNNMFSYIFNDDYNNQGNHLTLFVFEGTTPGFADNTNITEASSLSKIAINGETFASIGSGVAVSIWGGHNWFQVTYPTSYVHEGATLEFERGFVAGDAVLAGCRFVMNSNLKWVFDGFTDPVTATFNSIFNSDAWNTNQKVLLVYNGNTYLPKGKITNSSNIHNYDKYVTINGLPLSSYNGGSIQSWPEGGQNWIIINFPAVSTGDVLRIEKGMRFYTEVFGTMKFVFGETKWANVPLISDNDLIANNDVALFTTDDYDLTSDANSPLFSPSANIGALEGSFGFRFNYRIPTDKTSTPLLRLFGTDRWGGDALVYIYPNYGGQNKTIMAVGNPNSFDWTTYKDCPFAVDTDYLVEVYCIRTSDTSMVVLFVVNDEKLIWTSASIDLTGKTLGKGLTMSNAAGQEYYSAVEGTKELALERFVNGKMHMQDVSFGNRNDTDGCKGENGFYAEAKAYYNSLLTPSQRKEFASNSSYLLAKERLIAWGAANGETVSFDSTTGNLIVSSNKFLLPISENSNEILIITIVASVSIISFAMLVLLKKKKHSK